MDSPAGSTRCLLGRNALPTLLAPDILTTIFFQLIRCCESDEYRWRRHPYSWIWVTHVCRHWRTNALSTPLLWSHIVICGSDWTRECLIRSGQVPLRVSLHRGTASMEDAVISLSLILRQYPRIRSLYLEVPKGSYEDIAKVAEIDFGAPLLQFLSLQMTDRGPSDGSDVLSLFVNGNRALPTLNTLELGGLDFPWKISHFPNSLRHLSITNTHYQSDYHDMLGTLERLPLLESLEIFHAVPHMPEDIARETIFLHNLRTLKMACSAFDCDQFLTVATVTQAARLTLDCDLDDKHTDLPSFAQTIARLLGGEDTCDASTSVRLLSISIRCDEYEPWRLLILRGWRTVQPLSVLEDEDADIEPDVTLKLTLSDDLRDREGNAIRGLLPKLPLTKVQAVSIENVNTQKPEETLVGIFSQMRDLHTLGFSSTSGLTELLRRSGGAQEQEVLDEPRLLPALSRLRLSTVRFIISRKTLAYLQTFLERRKKEGTMLERLILDDCTNLDHECVGTLKLFVGEVVWDGFVSDIDEPSDSENSEEGSPGEESEVLIEGIQRTQR